MFERIESLNHAGLVSFLKMFSTDRITSIRIKFLDTHGYQGAENPAGYKVRATGYEASELTLATLESDFADENIQITHCSVRYDNGYSNTIDIECLGRRLLVRGDEKLVPIEILRDKKMIGKYDFFREVEYKFT